MLESKKALLYTLREMGEEIYSAVQGSSQFEIRRNWKKNKRGLWSPLRIFRVGTIAHMGKEIYLEGEAQYFFGSSLCAFFSSLPRTLWNKVIVCSTLRKKTTREETFL